jgi:heme/copper-type cytochrome/quinol oxidase subunit 3
LDHAAAIPSSSQYHHGIDQPVHPALGVTWGKLMMWLFLCSDAMSFGGLLAAYAAIRAGSDSWPQPNQILNIPLTAFNTFVLICSSVSMVWAFAAAQRNDRKGTVKWLLVTAAGGVLFLSIQVYEYSIFVLGLHHELGEYAPWVFESGRFVPWSSTYGATFFATTCFHGMHVFGGVVYLSVMAVLAARGRFINNASPVELVGLYWHFVDLVWIMVFTFIYLV